MHNYWSWVVMSLVIQLGSQLIKPQNYSKGKRLTMPLRKRFPRVFDHMFCRTMQIIFWIMIASVFQWIWSPFKYIYWLGICALAIDDYFSDDDTWKRFKDAVRNKIKWKMELPKPVPVGGKVGS